MSHGKMSTILLFPLFGFTLVIKMGEFNFKSHWYTLISKKKMIWIYLVKHCLIWFKLGHNFCNNSRNTDFRLYWNSLIIFNYRICSQIKHFSGSFLSFAFFCTTIEVSNWISFIMILRSIEKLQWKFCI